ncbi:MAG: N4-gp56 family major capsid protein [Staphylococcus epidermidis]|nr:N4-gp56 family major capsid protein [Staphylococcus epidermidis]
MAQGTTTKSTQIVPEVLKPMMQAELDKKLRFAQFADIDSTLVGQPGDTLTFPAFVYSGDATVVPEGQKIPVDKIETNRREAKIHKIGKGTDITDEALLSGYGDPQGEAVRQHGLAIANKVDNDVLEALRGTKLTVSGDIGTLAGLEAAIDTFDDEDLEPMVLFIVRSKKLDEGEAILAKRGAVKLITKRDFFLETDRDPSTKTTALYSDKHYVAYLYDESKAVKVTKGAGTTDSGA